MPLLRSLCLGAALALVGVPAQAADPQGRYAAHGLGRLSCAKFVEMCEKGGQECRLTGTYVDGYVTAFNALNKDTFDILPWQAPELVAEGAFNLCKRNPDAALIQAVTEVVRVLLPQRIAAAEERVKIGEEGKSVFLYRTTIRALQQKLIDAGHLKGKADGAFGPGTKAALLAFQKAAGIDESGLPDQRTLVALLYGGVVADGPAPRQGQAPRATGPAAAAAPGAAPAAASPPGRPAAPKLDLNLAPPAGN